MERGRGDVWKGCNEAVSRSGGFDSDHLGIEGIILHFAPFIRRPGIDPGTPNYIISGHDPTFRRIIIVAVITEDEKAARRNLISQKIVRRLIFDVRFNELNAIYINRAIPDFNIVARQADDTLHTGVILTGDAVMNDISPGRFFEAVGHFVDKQTLTGLERGLHALICD